MSSAADPLLGSVLDGRYQILNKIARGGMATVYRANDLRLARTVAVKIMRTDLEDDDDFAAKFDREARAAAHISHPNVVGVFDQGTSLGQPYIVMEFVEGETLRRLISRESPLTPLAALDIMEPIAAALAAAHEADLVHRDVKPENVLISDRGQIKVADFGLARATTAPQMTATGVLVGTASYLAPELVTHSRPDSRSDIYSTGILLFELLTRSKPHTGENNYQIAYRHVNVDVEPPSQRLKTSGKANWVIPDYIDALVAAATARNPDARIVDGRELLAKLRMVRRALVADPGADKPWLAAELQPLSSEQTTQPLSPKPAGRPRPRTAALASANSTRSAAAPVATEEDTPPNGTWQRVTASSPVSPVVRDVPMSRISPTPEDSGRQPRLSRTPVFPNLQISQDPVHKRRRGFLLALLVILFAVGVGGGSWWWVDGRFTSVPSLTNISEAEAGELAAANDLTINSSLAFSEDVPAGLVISADPAAGDRVLRDSEVALVISRGPERFEMPKVVGTPLADAQTALESVNLVVGDVTESWSEEVEKGIVISASQDAGAQLKRDTTVDLTVSKGRQPIDFVDYTGKDAAAAEKQLKDAGFKVSVTEENSATVKAGLVISQSPNTGSGHRGDEVKLVKSLGPVMVEVPDLRYKSKADAKTKLEELGFKVEIEYVTDFPLALEIASGTNPAAGTKQPEGSTIKLLIA